jgi:phosphoribosylamine--glycine ligase
MGAVSPVPFADAAFMEKVTERIVRPTIEGIVAEKLDYRGFVFFGLIKVGDDPYVIEYNCRLGDPETEVILPRLTDDLVPLLEQAARGQLLHQPVTTDSRSAVTTILVSGGYPGSYQKGKQITGLDQVPKQCLVFHAGTSTDSDGVVTSGGRVIAVTALADDLHSAKTVSAAGAAVIRFEGKFYRDDIGWEFF